MPRAAYVMSVLGESPAVLSELLWWLAILLGMLQFSFIELELFRWLMLLIVELLRVSQVEVCLTRHK